MKEQLMNYWRQLAAMPGSDSPLLRWGVLSVAVIMFWGLILEPYQAWSDMRKEMLQSQLHKVERLRGLQHSAKDWSQASQDYSAAIEKTRPVFLQAASYAMAQSELSSYVIAMAGTAHLKLDSQRLLDMELVESMGEQVAVYLRVRGKLADMLAFVDAVAQADKLVLLDDLYIGVDTYGKATMQFKAFSFRPLAAGL